MKSLYSPLLICISSFNALSQSPGIWTPLAPLATARQEEPGAVSDGKIYVAGGIASNLSVLSSMEVYDAAAGVWTNAAGMPGTRHHHASATANGKIYVMGGYGSIVFTAVDDVFEYNPQSDQWTVKEPLPLAIGAGAAVEFGGYIYFIGGTTGSVTLDVNLRYDPINDSWDSLAPMPTPREHHAAAVIDSLIYVVGGRGTPMADTRLEAYSPASDTWYSLANMLTGRSGLNAAALNGRLYAMGGEIGGIHGEMEEYNPITNTWRSLQPMITPRHGIAAATVGNEIYVIGGAFQENFGPSNVNEAFSFPDTMHTGIAENDEGVGCSLNSTNGILRLHVTAIHDETISVSLFDMSGKLLQKVVSIRLSTGKQVISLNAGSISGMIICDICGSDFHFSAKVALF